MAQKEHRTFQTCDVLCFLSFKIQDVSTNLIASSSTSSAYIKYVKNFTIVLDF